MKVTACLFCGNTQLTKVTHRSDDNGILRCSRCRVMMVEHISDDTEQLYTADYFEKPTDTKSGYTNYLSSPVANLIGKYAFTRLFARKTGKHLDLGCADGSLIEIFGSEGFDSRGLEISKDAVAIANTKGLNVSFSKLDRFPADLPKSNVITAFDLLEHADKPGVVLREVYDNLADDGYFVFSTLSVKKNNPSDYWFNHSLEHYVYYNQESLNFILTEVFGKGRFAFVEMEINGIAEFWGFGKKGELTGEKKLIDLISKIGFDKSKPDDSYLLSLFYNQLSKFEVSEQIIDYFKDDWPIGNLIQAKFYNYYYQGRYEIALKEADQNKHLLSAKNSIYWQALADAQQNLFRIKQDETTKEILSLREQAFKLRDELQGLKSSRIVGRIIRLRGLLGRLRPHVKQLPRKILAKLLPKPVRSALNEVIGLVRQVKHRLATRRHVDIDTVENKLWSDKLPLVSVVIPYYNRADTIDETLASLSEQTFTNFETIIVNDGSTDQTSVQKLEDIKQEMPHIKVIDQQNQGVAAARNNGIKNARGKYIICLDSDDMLDPTFIEKATLLLEANPDASLVTTHQDMFGVINEIHVKTPYNARALYSDNMVITAAEFRKEAWDNTGGYKSDIGYEDWEFWITLSEHGSWGRLIPEPLFKYRTSMQSRYVEDKDVHWNNINVIRSLHPNYKQKIDKLVAERRSVRHVIEPSRVLINMDKAEHYKTLQNDKKNVLVAVPWMTFGGAETLVLNFCNEIKDSFNLTFVTGLKSDHEWEHKFKQISPYVYHLANLYDDPKMYLEFLSNYITTRNISILHIVHTSFVFDMLPELKKRHPELKIIVTVFNDRAHFNESIECQAYVDTYTTDNETVANHYRKKLEPEKRVAVIPNGINSATIFNPSLYDKNKEREELGIEPSDLAVFFIGRLSEEKNPDVFLETAKSILESGEQHIKFYVVGDGGMRALIEKTIASLNSDKIKYLGYQSNVAKYLSAADIFVLPSSIEGFPLSILEAMAMRVIVVASDVGAVAEVVEDGKEGFIVTPGSASEITNAIQKLAADPKAVQEMKRTARQKVNDTYSNKILGDNYKKLYKSVFK